MAVGFVQLGAGVGAARSDGRVAVRTSGRVVRAVVTPPEKVRYYEPLEREFLSSDTILAPSETVIAPSETILAPSETVLAPPGTVLAPGTRIAPLHPATAPPPAVVPGPTELSPAHSIYQTVAALGEKNGTKPAWKIFLSSFIGGCFVGFGALQALAIGGACPGLMASNPGFQNMIVGAFGFPLSGMMIISTGQELFTGNTMTLTAAFHEGKVTARQVAKSWILSFLGNFLGCLFLVGLVSSSGLFGSLASPIAAAQFKTSGTFLQMMARGALCGWMVTMAAFMASGAKGLAGKMMGIWWPVAAFTAMKMEHGVANMFTIPLGMVLGADVTVKAFLMNNLLPVVLGNVIGGSLIMATATSCLYGALSKRKSDESSTPAKVPEKPYHLQRHSDGGFAVVP